MSEPPKVDLDEGERLLTDDEIKSQIDLHSDENYLVRSLTVVDLGHEVLLLRAFVERCREACRVEHWLPNTRTDLLAALDRLETELARLREGKEGKHAP